MWRSRSRSTLCLHLDFKTQRAWNNLIVLRESKSAPHKAEFWSPGVCHLARIQVSIWFLVNTDHSRWVTRTNGFERGHSIAIVCCSPLVFTSFGTGIFSKLDYLRSVWRQWLRSCQRLWVVEKYRWLTASLVFETQTAQWSLLSSIAIQLAENRGGVTPIRLTLTADIVGPQLTVLSISAGLLRFFGMHLRSWLPDVKNDPDSSPAA